MTQAFNLSQFANKLNSSGQTDNTGLQNSAVTVTAGTGMSGGGSVSLGGSTTLTNAGVTSLAAGTGISLSGSTGAVTVSASGGTGVTSLNGNTGALLGYDKIGSLAISGTNTTLNFTGIPSGYSQILIYGSLRVSNDGADSSYSMRISTNNGSSYISSSTYTNFYFTWDQDAGPSTFTTPHSGWVLGGDGTNRGWYGGTVSYVPVQILINQASTTSYPTVQYYSSYQNTNGSGGDWSWIISSGMNQSTNSYINAFQFTRLGGNKTITGGYLNVYGTKI
jgi:hypothetical protein